MFKNVLAKAKTIGTAVSTAAVVGFATVTTAFAQTVPVATTPIELIQNHSVSFTEDTKGVLFAGAGLLIGAYLIKALVNLVINFFRRG